jgi:membrane protein YqaA with SNARE-associated domain
MATLDEWLQDLFSFLGPAGALVALFLLFFIDATIFPALPELAIVVVYLYGAPEYEPIARALLLLGMAAKRWGTRSCMPGFDGLS